MGLQTGYVFQIHMPSFYQKATGCRLSLKVTCFILNKVAQHSIGVRKLFFLKPKLIKNDKKFSAKLLFKDVSSDAWDQANLTKANLDFSIDSVRVVNEYADRLCHTEFGQQLLKEHPDNFTTRIGAYLGEVIKNHKDGQYRWYDFNSIKEHTVHLTNEVISVKDEAVLYSKKMDKVVCPIYEVKQYLAGQSHYKSFVAYVEHAIKS